MIQLSHVSKIYTKNGVQTEALQDISLHVEPGDMVDVMGPSASGKTTLLNIIGGLLPPTDGTVVINGMDISKYNANQLAQFRKRNIGFVFQHFELMQQYDVTENIELPLLANGCPKKERREKSCHLLEELGLQDIAGKYPSELSGGQQQRVALARALIHNPPLILADEPTGSLDLENRHMIMEFLQKVNESGKTIVLVTHNPEVSAYCKTHMRLSDGTCLPDMV